MSLINKQNLVALEKVCEMIADYISACECNYLENHIQLTGADTPEYTHISNLIFSNILSKLDLKVLELKLSDEDFKTEEVGFFIEDMLDNKNKFFIPECDLQEHLNDFKKTLTEGQFYDLFEGELEKIANDYEMSEEKVFSTILESCDYKLLKKLSEGIIGEAVWDTSDYWTPGSGVFDLSSLLEKKQTEDTNKPKIKTL